MGKSITNDKLLITNGGTMAER